MNRIFFSPLNVSGKLRTAIQLSKAYFAEYSMDADTRGLSRFFCKAMLPQIAYIRFIHVAIHASFHAKDLNVDTCYSDIFSSKSCLGIYGKN